MRKAWWWVAVGLAVLGVVGAITHIMLFAASFLPALIILIVLATGSKKHEIYKR